MSAAWVGDKQDTTRLGVTTIVLGAVALAAALAVHRTFRGRPANRLAIAFGLALPALVCFTTVGRLWYVPGALLLGSGALVLAGSRRSELTAVLDERRWRSGLLVMCGAYDVFLGTALGTTGLLGVLGGALIWGAAGTARRSPALAYALLAGALPFASVTWWSVVAPLVAVLAVTLGVGLIRSQPQELVA